MLSKILAPLACLGLAIGLAFSASNAKKPHILFFSKSSGFEHSVISWKNGQPSHAEKVLLELGAKQGWDFEFSKDGSKFSKEYLAQFDAVFFYTTGNLLDEGTDKNPPMTAEGKQALFDFVKAGKGFIGTHSASDTFHTDNEAVKGPERYLNHGEKADPYVRFLGAEFIIHGAQQVAKNTVINPAFPGFESIGKDFAFQEEWYSLKDFRDDIHVLTTIDSPAMEGSMYGRPAYPSTWARKEGEGRVWYTAMGHREDVWTNPTFQKILIGGIHWALGTVKADVPANLITAAPGAGTNPPYVPQKPKAPAKPKASSAPKAQ
jgi:type 1 glutamine amidotransferase